VVLTAFSAGKRGGAPFFKLVWRTLKEYPCPVPFKNCVYIFWDDIFYKLTPINWENFIIM
jgi:hypothetical protein